MSRLTRDGTAEPVSRDQILRHARGQRNIIFPVQLTTSRIGNLTRLIHTLLYVMTIHTYIHTSMKWRYLGYLQLLSKAKHSFTVIARKEVCPRDEIADPPGTAVLPIDRHGFAEGLVPFRTLCGVQSSLMRFAPNRAIARGPPQWQQAPLETLCFSPAFS